MAHSREAIRDSRHGRVRDHGQPGSASFLIDPGVVQVSEGIQWEAIAPATVARSQVLTHAQRDASAEGCRVPTSFTAEQINLWASYTRMPRVFMTQSRLLSVLAALEVADMLDDAKSVTGMCTALALDYLAPLEPDSCTNEPEDQVDPLRDTSDAPRHCSRRDTAAKMKAKCKHPPPHLGIRHAFLWGAGLRLEGQLRAVGPAEAHHCCRAAQARHGHRRSSAAAHSPQAMPGTVFEALEALPEHLLLLVLRGWAAPLATQLGTLPRRMHPAAVTAAHPSVDSSRCVSLGVHRPETYRHALRAVAALGSMRRVASVTLTPPSHGSAPDELRLAVRHLRHVSAVTSLHLGKMPQEWLGHNDMHGLSRIAAMPHIRALGLGDVKFSLVPALNETLSCMRQLQQLDLGVCMVPLLVDGGWGGAGVVRHLTALTALEAVKLKIRHKWLGEPGDDAITRSVVPLLRDLRAKRVELEYFRVEFMGKLDASSTLCALRAAAAQLDFARCSIEVSGTGSLAGLRQEALTALWRALVERKEDGDAVCVSMHGAGVGRDIDGVWLDHGNQVPFIPAGFFGNLPGLKRLIVSQEQRITRSTLHVLTHELHKMTSLTGLYMEDCGLSAWQARALMPRLSVLTALQELHVEGVDRCIGADGAQAVAAGLPALDALTALKLLSNYIGERGAQAVLAALPPAAAAKLASLDLHRNDIGSEGFAAVAARLPEMVSLRELDMGANVGWAEGMSAIYRSLAARRVQLTALTALHLERNFLECSGAAVLARTLPFLPRLTDLDVKSNAIGSVGMSADGMR